MAFNMESSIQRGSDSLFEFSCFTCQENDRNTEAEIYCEDCSKLYCNKCEEHHNYLYKKHAILSKNNISQWPETKVDELEQCQEHTKEKLTGFCEDHSQLICHVCHINNHQKCSHVLLLADKVKDLRQKGDFKQLSATVDTQHQQLIDKKDDFEKNMKSLEKSYKKILEQINYLHKTINDSLNQLEKNTKKELDTLRATTRTSIQTDIKNCNQSIKNITCLKDNWLKREYKSEAMSFINYRKCLDESLKVEAVLQKMTTNDERTLKFNPDTTIQQTLSTLYGFGQILSTFKHSEPSKWTTQNTGASQNKPKASRQSYPGNQKTPGFMVKKSNQESISSGKYSRGTQTSDMTRPDQVCDPVSSSSHQLVQRYQPSTVSKPDPIIQVKSSMKYRVKIESDSSLFECNITGICETSAGELILIDRRKDKVKLLDLTYKVVAHYDLRDTCAMCNIDSSLVAVTNFTTNVYFIRVTDGQLVEERMMNLQHSCYGIAFHQGNLYITDGTALYHYTVYGRLVSKMYADASGELTVTSCAVSADGDRIYVVNEVSGKLVTLFRDGDLYPD